MKNVKLDAKITAHFWADTIQRGNLPVGKVIVAFASFATIIVDAINDNGGKGLRYAKLMFKAAFPGDHKDGTTYHSLPLQVRDDKTVHHYACQKAIERAFDEMKSMELSVCNIKNACLDLQACARYYAEKTIDAAKTGELIIVPNLKNLRRVKARSRVKNWQVRNDWDKKIPVFEHDKAKTGKTNVEIVDIPERLRTNICEPELETFSYECFKHEQVFSKACLAWCQKVAEKEEQRNLPRLNFVRQIRDMFYSASQMMRNKRKEIREELKYHKISKDEASDRETSVQESYNGVFAGLTAMLRKGLEDLDPKERMAICLAITFEEKKADQKASVFAQKLLPEEFLGFVAKVCSKAVDVATDLSNPVDACKNVFDGEQVELHDGMFWDQKNDRYVIAEDDTLEGTFRAYSKGHGKWVLKPDVKNALAENIRIPAIESNTIVLISKDIPNLDTQFVDAQLHSGDMIQAMPTVQNGYDKEYQSYLAKDGKMLLPIRCGKLDKTKSDKGLRENKFIFKSLCRKEGTFVTSVNGVCNGKNTLIVVMKDVHACR